MWTYRTRWCWCVSWDFFWCTMVYQQLLSCSRVTLSPVQASSPLQKICRQVPAFTWTSTSAHTCFPMQFRQLSGPPNTMLLRAQASSPVHSEVPWVTFNVWTEVQAKSPSHRMLRAEIVPTPAENSLQASGPRQHTSPQPDCAKMSTVNTRGIKPSLNIEQQASFGVHVTFTPRKRRTMHRQHIVSMPSKELPL